MGGGSRGLFLKLYLPSFYLIRRPCQLFSESWGVLMRIAWAPCNSLLLLNAAWGSGSLSSPPPCLDKGFTPGAEAVGRVEPCLW